MDNEAQSYPLAVDLDGTLILTDMSWVSIRRVILPRPWRILGFLWLELTGRRAVWKQKVCLVEFPEYCSWAFGRKGEVETGNEVGLGPRCALPHRLCIIK